MKIVSIRLKNLASLSGEHFIDFASEPLASAGLVAIIGKTGAGKSTILDAMCLALFNKIPRLKDSDGKLTDVDGSELLTNSPLTVLRRGTAHGFAELCFVAQDQKHYLARWELKRSREKADGKLQSVQRYLTCLTDGVVIADKAKAVDASILKITQLSFEQFTRAVLLAQSEVTAFLKARDNERGELLEYLTNSSIFGKIGQLAFEKTKLAANARKELENLLGHVEVLSDTELAEFTTQFQQVDADYKKLELEKSQLEKQQQWFDRKHKFDRDIILKQHNVDLQLKSQQNLAAEKAQLKRLEIFADIRPNVFQQQQFVKTEQQLRPQIQQQQNLFDDLHKQYEIEKLQYQQAETALNSIQNVENTHQAEFNQVRKCVQERDFLGAEFKKVQLKLQDLEQLQRPLLTQKQDAEQQIQQLNQQQDKLKQQLETSQQFNRLDKGLSAHLHQLGQFIQQYQNIDNQSKDLNQTAQQLVEYKQQLQLSVEQHGAFEQIETQLEQLRQQREQKIKQLNQLDFIQQKLVQFFQIKDESNQIEIKLKHSTEQFLQLEKTTLQTEQDYLAAQKARQQIQLVLQQQRLLHAENVEHLRAELKEGEACLVCGSTTHPYKTDDAVVSKALFELQQQQEQQATLKEQEGFTLWQNAQKSLTQLNAQLDQFKSAHQSLVDKTFILQDDLIQQLNHVNIQLDLNQPQAEIHLKFKQFEQQQKGEIQQLEAQLNTALQANKQQQQLQQNIQQIEHLLHTAQNLHGQVQHITQCLSDTEQQNWQQHTTQTAQHVYSKLNQRVQHLEQLEQQAKQFDQTTQRLASIQLKLENATQHISNTQQELEKIKQQGQENTEIATQLIRTISGLSDIKPNEWLAEHDANRQHVQNQYQHHKQSFDQQRHQFEQQKGQLEQLKAQLQQCQNNLNQVNIEIQYWLKQHPDFQQQDLDTLSQISSSQEQQIRQQLQNAERLLNDATSALKTVQEQLTEHLHHQPEIDLAQLQQLILDHVNALRTQLEIRDQLKLKLEVHQQNIAKQKQYFDKIEQIQQEEHRWNKISSLMGDSTGKKFRDYAQQYNLDILLEYANQQLALLSQRYTLKRLENSLSLAIIDHDMDGETRSVASLSGGESFLTALALSLAIANMASGSMKIESLFIDEGFGTLDASSLHMVMNALDQLQNQGRKVVLISHIQEMHERIPVQIQVRPLGAGASTIQIVS
ncbi:SbcC/MukB-like Walker B domain-containing protein [Acinetobacter rongchengensis]|uniref:ATP-dependent dsDNA exonuclease n=1 Tax=Acinetobacter rongchengensis TaxID=2419601 RepID=A0A3A8EUG8_9GAMM|nr:SbcC/MukB-like Walker B domain-containing protein [Acinetobacter rongchengensis]RKG37086.1 ATP-dependent dsDNA exonuclease [Acinetobacter rongchengensis]